MLDRGPSGHHSPANGAHRGTGRPKVGLARRRTWTRCSATSRRSAQLRRCEAAYGPGREDTKADRDELQAIAIRDVASYETELLNIRLAEDAVAGLKDALAARVQSEAETEALLGPVSPPAARPG